MARIIKKWLSGKLGQRQIYLRAKKRYNRLANEQLLNRESEVKDKMNITGFHQDELGDWIATLSCGHQRHVRHKPPLSNYPWVMTKEGRQGYIGVEVVCRLCKKEALEQKQIVSG